MTTGIAWNDTCRGLRHWYKQRKQQWHQHQQTITITMLIQIIHRNNPQEKNIYQLQRYHRHPTKNDSSAMTSETPYTTKSNSEHTQQFWIWLLRNNNIYRSYTSISKVACTSQCRRTACVQQQCCEQMSELARMQHWSTKISETTMSEAIYMQHCWRWLICNNNVRNNNVGGRLYVILS